MMDEGPSGRHFIGPVRFGERNAALYLYVEKSKRRELEAIAIPSPCEYADAGTAANSLSHHPYVDACSLVDTNDASVGLAVAPRSLLN
jgi:hypothetical protein